MIRGLSVYFQKNVLNQLDHPEIVDAEDGVQALVIFEQEIPDLMLVDCDMPNMDGITLIRNIRERHKSVPIIMCTAEAEKTRALEAVKAGVNSYITKPFTVESLREKIEQTMAKTGA